MEEWEACQNRFHVLPWWLIKLKPSNTMLVKEQMQEFEKQEEWEFERDFEKLSNIL
jgi:hypothetical protein